MTTLNDVLAALAGTSPRQYVQRSPSGLSYLQDLYQQCIEADLVPAAAVATDDIARLHSLFDVALDHGLGSLVLDYVHDVCADRLLTSSDPVAAFLLDGECVRRWCQKTATVSKGRLTSWLGRGIGFIASSGTLPQELGKLKALQWVVRALSPAGTAGESQQAQQMTAEEEEVARLVQCSQVLMWLGEQEGVVGRPSCGRFSSEQEWRGEAGKRKDGAAPASLFVADTLEALGGEGVSGVQYPPGSCERLVGGLFLGGSTARTAWMLKLSLLAYWLVDGGFLQPQQLAGEFSTAFHVPRHVSMAWVLSFFLDDSHSSNHSSSQQGVNAAAAAAAALLPEVGSSQLPFKALQVLVRRGHPAAALTLLRQRGTTQQAQQGAGAVRSGAGASPAAALQEAEVAVAVLLGNGLLVEAHLQVKRHLGTLRFASAEQHTQHAQQLLSQLLHWGMTHGQLHAIIRLPLTTKEEEVCCQWLAQQAGSHPRCALILVLFYVMRGRTPEALLAHARHCAPPSSEEGYGDDVAEAQAQLEELLRQAGASLPAVQRALSVREAREPALRMASDAAQQRGVVGEEWGGLQGSVPLSTAVPGLSSEGMAPLLTQGPSPLETPLVGSVPTLLALVEWQHAQRDAAISGAAEGAAAGARAEGRAPTGLQAQQRQAAATAAALPQQLFPSSFEQGTQRAQQQKEQEGRGGSL